MLGLGEIGEPLKSILGRKWHVAGLDVDADPGIDQADIVHVCYPLQIDDFVGTTSAYIDRFNPRCTIIHSTITPGTTQAIRGLSADTDVYYSPIRGKHATMEEDLLSYAKFVSGPDKSLEVVQNHLEAVGLTVERMEPTEVLEIAKLLETTYFGLLIAWAQEADRFAKVVDSEYSTVNRFFEEVPILPSSIFPGHIGGHCVMPNIELLMSVRASYLLDFIESSNETFPEEGNDQ